MDGNYRGWVIFYDARAPITGKWRARRHGVGMCANTEEQLRRMIDQKVSDPADVYTYHRKEKGLL